MGQCSGMSPEHCSPSKRAVASAGDEGEVRRRRSCLNRCRGCSWSCSGGRQCWRCRRPIRVAEGCGYLRGEHPREERATRGDGDSLRSHCTESGRAARHPPPARQGRARLDDQVRGLYGTRPPHRRGTRMESISLGSPPACRVRHSPANARRRRDRSIRREARRLSAARLRRRLPDREDALPSAAGVGAASLRRGTFLLLATADAEQRSSARASSYSSSSGVIVPSAIVQAASSSAATE
jgi:hypothetical protein